jgi:hypothetical protein
VRRRERAAAPQRAAAAEEEEKLTAHEHSAGRLQIAVAHEAAAVVEQEQEQEQQQHLGISVPGSVRQIAMRSSSSSSPNTAATRALRQLDESELQALAFHARAMCRGMATVRSV